MIKIPNKILRSLMIVDKAQTADRKKPNEIRYSLCSKMTLTRGAVLMEKVIKIQARPKAINGHCLRNLKIKKAIKPIKQSPASVSGGLEALLITGNRSLSSD